MEYTKELNHILNKFYDYLYYKDCFDDKYSNNYLFNITKELGLQNYISDFRFYNSDRFAGSYDKDSKIVRLSPFILGRFTNVRKLNKNNLILEYFRVILFIFSKILNNKIINEENNIDSRILLLSRKMREESTVGLEKRYDLLYPDSRKSNIEASKVIFSYVCDNNKDYTLGSLYILKALVPNLKRVYIDDLYTLITSDKLDIDISGIDEYKRLLYGFKLNSQSDDIIENAAIDIDCNTKFKNLLRIK